MKRREFLATIPAASAAVVCPALTSCDKDTIPVAGEFDLVVAGGSATGVCAAVTAARSGLKVALVEYNAFYGGTATAALVPVWHSLYSTDGKTKIIGGLTDEIENRLLARGEAELQNPDNPSVGCYMNVAALQIVLDDIVKEAGTITPFLKTHIVGAEVKPDRTLKSAIIEDKSGRRKLNARYFIDATGDADLARRAGFETWRFKKEDIQGHTLCAIISGEDKIKAKYPDFRISDILKPASGAGLKHVYMWEAPIIGCPGLSFIAATRIYACDPSNAEELTDALMEGRRQLKAILDTANRLFPMPIGERLALVALGSDLGIRESCHIKAQYKVTEEDVLQGRHFEDCCLKGSYRVDIHTGRGIILRYLNGVEEEMVVTEDGNTRMLRRTWCDPGEHRPTWYEAPLRALMPVGAKNLICAGRMIDCEREAFGALRVMVNCNQMGEAAARWVVQQCSI